VFVANYEPHQRMTVFAWATGFFTGSNMASIATAARYRDLSDLGPDLVVTRLLGHCTQNPRDPVMRAVEYIYFGAPLIVAKDPVRSAKAVESLKSGKVRRLKSSAMENFCANRPDFLKAPEIR
jgi:hypothetical protein